MNTQTMKNEYRTHIDFQSPVSRKLTPRDPTLIFLQYRSADPVRSTYQVQLPNELVSWENIDLQVLTVQQLQKPNGPRFFDKNFMVSVTCQGIYLYKISAQSDQPLLRCRHIHTPVGQKLHFFVFRKSLIKYRGFKIFRFGNRYNSSNTILYQL